MIRSGAFRRSTKAPHRTLLNYEHRTDLGNVIGPASELIERGDGLYGTFRVLPGMLGDHAIEVIRSGACTGLSVSAALHPQGSRIVDGVVERNLLILDHVALTASPAYDGAEITALRSVPVLQPTGISRSPCIERPFARKVRPLTTAPRTTGPTPGKPRAPPLGLRHGTPERSARYRSRSRRSVVMANPVLDRLYSDRSSLLDQVDSVTADAEENDRDLSSAEMELIARCHSRIESELDPQIEAVENIERTRAAHVRTVPPGATLVPSTASDGSSDDGPVSLYRTYGEYARDVIISRYDQIAARAGNGARAAASERIERAVVNTLSSDVAGLIRPQYLDQIAQVIDKSRPIVDSARHINLSSGTLTYPSITHTSVRRETDGRKDGPVLDQDGGRVRQRHRGYVHGRG